MSHQSQSCEILYTGKKKSYTCISSSLFYNLINIRWNVSYNVHRYAAFETSCYILNNIISHDWVTIDGVWIGSRIYFIFKQLVFWVTVFAGRMQQTLATWNSSACRTNITLLLATLTRAQKSGYCAWLSKFLVCMIMWLNYVIHWQKSSKII
jgi:hypothetical protein